MVDVQQEQLSKTGNMTITKSQQEEAAQKVLRQTIMSALTGAGQTSQDQVTFQEPLLQEENSSYDKNSLVIKQPTEIEQHFRKNATPLSILSDPKQTRENLSSFSKQPGSRTVFSRKSSNKLGDLIRRENSRQESHPPTTGNTRDSITTFKGQTRNYGNVPFRQSIKRPLPPRFPQERELPQRIVQEPKKKKSTIQRPSLVTLRTQDVTEKGIKSKKEVKRQIVYKPLSSTTPRDQKKAGVSTRIPVASKLIRHPVSTYRSNPAITEEEDSQRELALQTTRYHKNGRSPRPGRESIDTSLFTSEVNYTTNDGFYSRTPGMSPFMTTQRLNAQSRIAKGMNDTTETLTKHLEQLKKQEIEAQTPHQTHIPAKSFISPIIIEEAEKRGEQLAEKQITGKSEDDSEQFDPQIQLISDIYDHFVVHQSPIKPVKNLFRQNYKPLKNKNTHYSDLAYISRAEDIENRLMTDQYYALRYEARKVKHLVTLMRKFEHRRSQSSVENLMSEPDMKKEEGFDVSTLLPPDTTRQEYIRKMGHFSVIAPTASPLDLTDPESCFKQYSRKYMQKPEFNNSVSRSLIEPDRYNRFAHVYSFKPSDPSSKAYSELGKEDMIVDQNQKLQLIRKKLKQARPLMNVQFTSHIISRAPFKTIDDLNEEEKAQIEIDNDAKSHSRMLSSPAVLGNKHSKRWLLYDLNPPRQQPKEFYLNVLDKGSNFILPTIESRASQGFSLTEKQNRKIRSVLSKKQNTIALPRFSRAQQLKRGVQSGIIKPARIKPSINSPAPVTSLQQSQKGSLLSLNLRDTSLPVVNQTRQGRKVSQREVQRKQSRFPPLSHRQQFKEDPEITALLGKL